MVYSQDVLTLQMGQTANYVGGHFWNVWDAFVKQQQEQQQKEGNDGGQMVKNDGDGGVAAVERPRERWLGGGGSDTREEGGVRGQGLGGEDAMDSNRLVCVDAQGSIRGGYQHTSTAYDHEGGGGGGERVEWDGRLLACGGGKEGGKKKEIYEYFGDFMKPRLAEGMMHVVPGLWRGGDQSMLKGWNCGASHATGVPWKRSEVVEEYMDSVRKLAEGSDFVAGFVQMVDDVSVWGCLSREILEDVRDEYAGRPVYLFSTRHAGDEHSLIAKEGKERFTVRKRLLEGLALASISPLVDVYVPMHDPCMNAKEQGISELEVLYRHSALHGVALHGATLPFRLQQESQGETIISSEKSSESRGFLGSMDIRSHAALFTQQHKSPLCALDIVLPCPRLPSDCASRVSDDRMKDRSKGDVVTSYGVLSNSLSFSRDAFVGTQKDKGRFVESVSCLGLQTTSGSSDLGSISKAVDGSLRLDPVRRVQHRTFSRIGVPDLPASLPPCLSGKVRRSPLISSSKVPAIIRMSGSRSFESVICTIRDEFVGAHASRIGSSFCASWGIEEEEISEQVEYLNALASSYSL